MATRQLSPEDIRALVAQGVDPSTIPDSIDIPDQQPQSQQPQGNQSSALGAGVRSAAASAIPTAAGGYAFVPGMEAGAALGSFGGPIGTGIGGLIGGGLTAYGASRLASAAQNKLLPTAVNQQLATDQSQHPIASTLGSLATLPLGGMNFNPEGVEKAGQGLSKYVLGGFGTGGAKSVGMTIEENSALLNAAIGGAMGGVQTAVQEKTEGKDLDPTQILINTAIGATFNKPNSIGEFYGFHPATQSLINDPKAIQAYQNIDRFGRQDGQVVDSTPAIIPPAAQQNLEGTIFRFAGIPQANDRPSGPLYPSPAEQSANNIDAAYREAANNVIKKIPVQNRGLTAFNPEVTTRNPNVVGSSLQQEMARNQIAGEPSSSLINHPNETVTPDYTGVTEQNNAEAQQESADDLAARRLEGTGDRYQTPSPVKTPLQTEVEAGLKANNLVSNLSPELQEAVVNEVMKKKGWVVNEQGALVDSNGQPVRGQTLVADNVRKIALSPDLATADTPAHEGAHAVYQELTSAANSGDSKANDLLNRLHSEQQPGLDAINEQRAKAGLQPWDHEEYFADQQGLTFVKRQMNLDNETGWQRWWNDTKSLLKTRWNTQGATLDDLRRAINYKMVNDSRFGALSDGSGVAGVRNQPNQEVIAKNKAARLAYFEQHKDRIQDYANKIKEVGGQDYKGGFGSAENLAKFYADVERRTGQSMETSFQGWKRDTQAGSFNQSIEPRNQPSNEGLTPEEDRGKYLNSPSVPSYEHMSRLIGFHDQLMGSLEQKVEQAKKIGSAYFKQSGLNVGDELYTPAGNKVKVLDGYMRFPTKISKTEGTKVDYSKPMISGEIVEGHPDHIGTRSGFFVDKLTYDNPKETRNQPAGEGLTPEDRRAIRKSGGEGERQPYPFTAKEVGKGEDLQDALTNYHVEKMEGDEAGNFTEPKYVAESEAFLNPKRNQPKDEGLETSHMGPVGGMWRSTIDKVHDIQNPGAHTVANAGHQTLIDHERLVGKYVNPLIEAGSKLTKEDKNKLILARQYDIEKAKDTGNSGRFLLQSNASKQYYDLERQIHDISGKSSIDMKMPVDRDGRPTILQQDKNHHYQTPNPAITNDIRANKDATLIKSYKDEWVDYFTKTRGMSLEKAEKSWTDFVAHVQSTGSKSQGGGNATWFSGARRQMGEGLPPSFIRPDPVQNDEAAYRSLAMAQAFYKNMESKPEVWGALGEKHDAWGKPVPQPEGDSIAGNDAVRNMLNEMKGEVSGGTVGRTTSVLESGATATLLGFPTEFHKLMGNQVKQFTYAGDPASYARMTLHAAFNIGEGWTHAKENGVVRMSAKSAADMFDSHLAFADRLAGATKLIRSIYTLGGLTDKLNYGLLQAANEHEIIPVAIKMANEGNATKQRLMKHLDPAWQLGKTYNPQEISQLASQMIGVTHGTHDARTLPPWMLHDNEISAFFKLSSWGVSQTNSFMRDVYTPALNGDIKPMIMSIFGAVVGGYLIKTLREDITGKRSGIPSLGEIQASDRGLSGNVPAVAYNLMAAASYAGFGGMLGYAARMPFDAMFKNQWQGATFPLDQVASDLGTRSRQALEAIMTDPNANVGEIASRAVLDFAMSNIQMARMAVNQGVNTGMITGTLAEKKMLSDKLGELRRFQMVSGLPFEEQGGGSENNPYQNLEQKSFKMEQDIPTAMKEAPALIQNIVQTYRSQPDIMMRKLEALKSNSYATMPDIDTQPIQFGKYMRFLTNYGGPQAAQAAMQDYWIHKIKNEVKSSVIP